MNLKRKVAVLLTGIMVFGSTFTVFAADPTNPTTANGTGEFEGHVDREIMDVVLPTVPDTYDPFDFQVDPERLIRETGGMRYAGKTFPAEQGDTGVYFLVSANEFANETNEFTAINKGAVSANLTVEVEAKASPAYNIELVSNKAEATPAAEAVEGKAKLYLGLKVADKDPVAVTSDNKASQTVVMNDSYDNYTVSWNSAAQEGAGGYEFIKKSDASGWDEKSFSIEGSTNYVKSADGATSPSITVTWKYASLADAAVEAEVNGFKTTYATLLAKPTSEVTGSDLTAINAALTALAGLSEGAQTQLASQKTTLEALKAAAEAAAAGEEAAAEADGFKTTYATILNKTTSTIAYADLGDVQAALDVYDGLSAAAKALLGTEKALLDDLKAAAEAKAIPTMTLQTNGNLTYSFAESGRPTGTLTMIKINGTGRKGQIDAGNITYNASNGFFKISAAAIEAIGGVTEGSTTIVATIGGVEYTLAY